MALLGNDSDAEFVDAFSEMSPQFYVGPAASGAPMHWCVVLAFRVPRRRAAQCSCCLAVGHDCACAARFDLLLCGRHNTALNTLAYGEKYWFLQPPDEAYYSVLPTSILAEQEVRSTT